MVVQEERVWAMSSSYICGRKIQSDFAVRINLPKSEYLQMSTGLVIFDPFLSAKEQYSRGQMRDVEQLWRRIVLLTWFIVSSEQLAFISFPSATHMKAPLKIMHGLTDQLSFFKVRVFIKIDRPTRRCFEVLPLPWPLQKGGVKLAIWDASPWSDKHSFQLLLFKPDQSCDLN